MEEQANQVGTDPLDVVIFSSGMAHDGNTLAQKSLGGSETAALMIAKALAKRGHYVTVFSPTQGCQVDGVIYAPIEQFQQYAMSTPHDVTIVSRIPEVLRGRFNSKLSILWCHDLAMKRARANLGSALWNLDAIYLLSRFQIEQYKEVNPQIAEKLYFHTRNGIDLSKFVGLENVPRDKNKVVYGSRPERGLEACLLIMEELWRQKSPLKLYVSSYDNQPDQLKDYYNYLYSKAQQLPNVVLLGSLKQADWYKHLASARMLIYPGVSGPFNEISCLVCHEAQACGTPIIALAKGALTETCPSQCTTFLGSQTQDVNDPSYIKEFVRQMMQIWEHDALFRSMSFAGREAAITYDWNDVAGEWEADWMRRLAEQVVDPFRVTEHLKRTGDLEALGEYQANGG